MQQLTDQIDPKAQGKLSGSLNAHNAVFDPTGERDGSTPVHQFAQPVAVLDTPSSLVLASDGAIAQYAGEHLSQIAQGDVQISAAHTAAQVSGHTTSLFTHAGGLQMKAANGPVSLRAHTDTLQLLAHKDIQILSVNSEITVSANSKIELIGADSGITLDGGNITFTTPGTWNAKGSFKELTGGGSGSAERPALPSGTVSTPPNWIELRHTYEDLEPVVGATYKVTFDDGSVRAGSLDGKGFVRIDGVKSGVANVEYGPDTRAWQPPPERQNPDFGRSTDQATAADLYAKYFGGAT